MGLGGSLRRGIRRARHAVGEIGRGAIEATTDPLSLVAGVGNVAGLKTVQAKMGRDALSEAKKKAAEQAAAVSAAKRQDLERRRAGLRLRGAKSTRVSGTTPDLFASISGQTKQLLG